MSVNRLTTRRTGLSVYRADALELVASLPDASVDLILTDPPYYRVKDEPWDRQWDAPEGFLGWVGDLCNGFRRVLKPNGSLYLFASPEMAGRVECVIRERFNVLNHIVWDKPEPCRAAIYGEERFREFVPKSERAIFAEHYGCEYQDAAFALHKQVFAPLGSYIKQERERAGLTRSEVEVALGFVSSSDPTRGTALCYRWEEGSSLPTPETYARLRALLNGRGGDFLQRHYDDLRSECDDLRRKFEIERSQFESLRRPFLADEDAPFTDVWQFKTVPAAPGKHPCEKPLDLLQHCVRISSRPGATILDPLCGSGSTGEAALSLGREFIGGDASEHWSQYAAARLDRQFGALPLGSGRTRKPQRSPGQSAFALEVETKTGDDRSRLPFGPPIEMERGDRVPSIPQGQLIAQGAAE